MPLIERSDSVLLVVDAQPGFYPGGAAAADMAAHNAARADVATADAAGAVAARAVAAWLVGVASALDVPIVVTEEDPAANGPTVPTIAARMPPGAPTFVKPVFGLADVPEILAAVVATGRHTAILAGAETDVCITHSAIGLRDRGFRVFVAADATYAPGPMHDAGIRRLRDLGVEVGHARGIYYEWMRDLAAARRFEAEQPDLAEPPGFSL